MSTTREVLASRLFIGRDGDGARIWLDIELAHSNGQEWETVNHETVTEVTALSITGSGRSRGRRGEDDFGGQIIESAASVVNSGTPEGDPAAIARLVEIWDAWHLSDMRAACAHQELTGDPADWLDTTEPCPVTGYQYGHAWLVEPLPAEVEAELREIIAALTVQ